MTKRSLALISSLNMQVFRNAKLLLKMVSDYPLQRQTETKKTKEKERYIERERKRERKRERERYRDQECL
jgi:hypothetical protein